MIDYEVRDGVAEILFNNAPVNAITADFMNALFAALERARDDGDVRAVVLGSAIPGRFCGGLDLPAFLRGTPGEAHAIVGKIYARLSELQSGLGKPSIAAVNGAARGAGMSIAITCDVIIAADHATFGYPEVDVGLLPAIHFNHLPRIIGRHRAFDLLFTGRSFDVAEAVTLGLVNRHVPEHELMAEARRYAAIFAAKSPVLMRLGKAAFLRAATAGYREGAEAAVDLISTVFGTEDCKEGLAAFAEKRKPVWKGA
ncbi:enoyl-CoA hydratase/isomerase family protein [Neoroseomonas soli]|uniref:Enoyl-CoA hydratase/isomerase family protein n=1 Tax=Neoroseomonas soli TaxID=1081025 RepID=A0A9X9WR92_9PROT|nr:enoyl-CoA hydratase/isomerase family protein [Neoroseomonas soli]